MIFNFMKNASYSSLSKCQLYNSAGEIADNFDPIHQIRSQKLPRQYLSQSSNLNQ